MPAVRAAASARSRWAIADAGSRSRITSPATYSNHAVADGARDVGPDASVASGRVRPPGVAVAERQADGRQVGVEAVVALGRGDPHARPHVERVVEPALVDGDVTEPFEGVHDLAVRRGRRQELGADRLRLVEPADERQPADERAADPGPHRVVGDQPAGDVLEPRHDLGPQLRATDGVGVLGEPGGEVGVVVERPAQRGARLVDDLLEPSHRGRLVGRAQVGVDGGEHGGEPLGVAAPGVVVAAGRPQPLQAVAADRLERPEPHAVGPRHRQHERAVHEPGDGVGRAVRRDGGGRARVP